MLEIQIYMGNRFVNRLQLQWSEANTNTHLTPHMTKRTYKVKTTSYPRDIVSYVVASCTNDLHTNFETTHKNI